MVDIFRECRERVSAQDVALYYGFRPNRANFIPCPFHREKTASLKLYPGTGGFYCFGCHRGGTVIDFVATLYDLSPLDAVRKLDADFHLALPLDKPLDDAAIKVIQHRREMLDTYKLFEEWCGSLTRQLCECYRLAHDALRSLEAPEDLDRLTDAQALAIREQPYLEWIADVLTGGTMAEKMEIFRERGRISRLVEQILNRTQTKSGAA